MEDRVFGMLTVIERAGSDSRKEATWRCRCECGDVTIVTGSRLRSGGTKSCGCLRAIVGASRVRHGLCGSPTHRTWARMVARCTNPNTDQYPRYGGRGITVCERWLTFENFHEDMGERPKGMTIDRINNDKGYSPSNCRWSTRQDQARNRTSNRVLSIDNHTACVAEWAEISGTPAYRIIQRLRRGWTAIESVFGDKQRKVGERSA